MQIEGKNVTVVGLARSGIGAANCLSEMGAFVTVTDINTEARLAEAASRLLPSVRLVLGGHPDDIFLSADMIVMSPGVPLEIKPVVLAKAKGIQVIGELELAYQIVMSNELRVTSKDRNSEPQTQNSKTIPSLPFLAVTGSNGKSTTTTLLDHMLKKSGYKTLLGGNIGNALTEEILKRVRSQKSAPPTHPSPSRGEAKGEGGRYTLNADYVVVEVSSFQLEAIDKFRPLIAAILNITPDHLDRYHSMNEYRDAKAQIYLNQKKNDYLLLNADDAEINKLATDRLNRKKERPELVYFSRKNAVEGIYYKNGQIYCNMPRFVSAEPHFPLISADQIRIKGVHNLENAMAAAAMALLANCPFEAVIDSLQEFQGLEHRLELVRELDGVKYVNDSKGTNVGAVVKSIESFDEPLILIAGGRDKAGDFSALRELVRERVKAVVLIGEAGQKIKDALGDLATTETAKDLREAVLMSRDMADQGDVVLLSPACASFDMFRDFEDRGRQFKNIVMELNKKHE